MWHVIAIERWGQHRLNVALGEPLLDDTNHDYKPPKETAWEDLQRQFAEVRAYTLEVADKPVKAQTDKTKTVPHNQFGPFSVGAWLTYLIAVPRKLAPASFWRADASRNRGTKVGAVPYGNVVNVHVWLESKRIR